LSISRVQVATVAMCQVFHTLSWAVRLHISEEPVCAPFNDKSLVVIQCAWVTILVATVWTLRQSLQTSFQRDLEAKTLRGEQFAFKALLRMFCDVVFELDTQLCLVGETHELCAFLLRGSNQAMEGTQLVELMPREEDRARFRQLGTSRDGPSVMHFSLRDGNGTLIEVEMFSFLFDGLDGKARCFAGLREFSDAAPPAADDERIRLASAISEPILTESPQLVTIDTADPSLPIQSISEGLDQLTGATKGSAFGRYLGNSREFTCWVQTQVNIWICAGHVPCPAQTSLEVRLRPRCDWAHSHIAAVCRLLNDSDNSSNEDSEGEDSHLRARVEIHTIRRRPGGFRGRSATSSRSSNSVHSVSLHSAASSNVEGMQTCDLDLLRMQDKAACDAMRREARSAAVCL